jgi:NAD(P)-dependent dehydrogenase (short-subunit alcohol dehydrogenase family)
VSPAGGIVVTGGASGMGAATVRRLVADGARVAIVDRDGVAARALAEELGEATIAVEADVSREEDVEAYSEAALAAFGRLDGVFLNAGIGSSTPLIEETADGFDRIVAVNLRGVFLGLRAALRQMRDQGGGGSVVVTASTAGLAGSDLAAYAAAKHGAVSLVKTAAVEGAAFGVRVNAIAPGSIDTPLMRHMEERLGGGEEAARILHATTPLGRHADRYGSGAEVASLVAFLLGEGAGWVTGATVPVEGGVLATDPYRLPDGVEA